MNKIGKNKWKWLIDQGAYLAEDKIVGNTLSSIYINNDKGERCYIGLTSLGENEYTVNFIYKHKLTKLDTAFNSGCYPVSIGFNEKEQKWYGWTHRGYGAFGIGYEITEGSIIDRYPHNYPYKVETLEQAKQLAIDISRYLD